MQLYENPDRSAWKELCRRPSQADPVVRERVERIIARVRAGGDAALRELVSSSRSMSKVPKPLMPGVSMR
ncbi:MAG: hypothetical protein J6T07_06500 [Bacteroidales bacterium]|nr:hypothetical protein [Bacteroidales bacterium]